MYKKETLPNGVRIITAEMEDRYSASAGIWVKNGSCFEQEHFYGASHYLEHMLFKGTPSRNALQIAEEIEYVGGSINAFTAKENTCFYAKCLGENIDTAINVLTDIYCNSLLDAKEFEKEKGVILEEINMYEDDPEDMAGDRFAQKLWQGHCYGRPVIGTTESVSALQAEELQGFYRQMYRPSETVLSVAGNVKHEQVVELAQKGFEGFCGKGNQAELCTPQEEYGCTYKYKDTEQMHICMGFPAVKKDDEDYYALNVLNTVLGGGAGSRLFQSAREQRGLTYSVYSYLAAYDMGGYWAAASSTAPNKIKELAAVMLEEIAQLRAKGITDAELNKAKQQLKGNLLLSQENTNNIMIKAGASELAYNQIITLEEISAQIAAVEQKDINRVIKRLMQSGKIVLSLVGPKEINIEIPCF